MIRGVRTLFCFLAVILVVLPTPAALAASPHGTYTSSSTLCELCHQTHDATSTAGQRNERAARMEEDNIDFAYTGAWTTETAGSRSAGSSMDSSQTSATVELTFNGAKVVWLATKTPASGRGRVYLDGLAQADIDLYSAANDYQAAVWRKTGLAKGSHTISIEVLGTKEASSSGFGVDVDAIDLRIPKVMLLRGQNEKAVCYTCHAGTGSSFDTAAQFGETTSTTPPVSKHPVPQGIILCSDCHSPHATAENWDTTTTPEPYKVIRLLRSVYSTFLGFVVRATNHWLDDPEPANVAMGLPEQRKLSKPYQLCGSCHGAGSTLPGGDLLKYYDYGGSKHDSTVSVSLDTSASIACMSCHEQHASSLPKLLQTTINAGPIAANDNTVCYACHMESKIASYDTTSGDVHGATDSTETTPTGLLSPYVYGQPSIRCVVCHSPHGTQNVYWIQPSINATSGISVDGTTAAQRGQWEGACAACHAYTHDSTDTAYDICVACHFHGAGNDSSTTTKF